MEPQGLYIEPQERSLLSVEFFKKIVIKQSVGECSGYEVLWMYIFTAKFNGAPSHIMQYDINDIRASVC